MTFFQDKSYPVLERTLAISKDDVAQQQQLSDDIAKVRNRLEGNFYATVGSNETPAVNVSFRTNFTQF